LPYFLSPFILLHHSTHPSARQNLAAAVLQASAKRR
jgi:hypothetical protein